MGWPETWAPFASLSEIAFFQDELQRALTSGHPLFGLSLKAIGRCWANDRVLFAFEEESGRVAMILLQWSCKPSDSSFRLPATTVYESFEEWARTVEWAMTLARLKPAAGVEPKYKPGDRVLMLTHADWKADARATIVGERRPLIVYDGSTRIEYNIEFDQPQTDLTDEYNGVHNEYVGTTVLEEYLRRLRSDTPHL